VEVAFSDRAIKDINYWKKTGNKKIQNRITELLKSIREDPFKGIGKPEPLRFDFSGLWSHRIDKEHRLIYSVDKNRITVASARFHYQIL
jgi:toxin YoeB